MRASFPIIGDPQVQSANWMEGLQQRWKTSGASPRQQALDTKWHEAHVGRREAFDRLLTLLEHAVFERAYVNGDMTNAPGFDGLRSPAIQRESGELASHVRYSFPKFWRRSDRRTGNHDICTVHPCGKKSDCQISIEAFTRFEQTWETPLFTRYDTEGVTILGLSSDLLLLDGFCEPAERTKLEAMRVEHVRKIRRAFEEAERVVVVMHSPEAFRVLMHPAAAPECAADLARIRKLWYKVAATCVGHLEGRFALLAFRLLYPLLALLVMTPLARVFRVVFNSPDAIELVRHWVYGCAKAALLMPSKVFLAPPPKDGFLELVATDGRLELFRLAPDSYPIRQYNL